MACVRAKVPQPLEQMDPLTRGALFHAVQFRLLGELKAADILPVNAANLPDALSIADRVLNVVAAEFADKLAPAIERVWRTEIEDLRTDLRGWLQHIAVNDDDWIPQHFEFAFGLRSQEARDPASTSEEAVLDEGVRLRGSIDLVERHATRGVLRVTDHKTGKPPEKTPAYVGGGLFLQPLLYGLAARQLLGRRSRIRPSALRHAARRIPARGDSGHRSLPRISREAACRISTAPSPPASFPPRRKKKRAATAITALSAALMKSCDSPRRTVRTNGWIP